MEIICPACRKASQSEAPCPRCGADLVPLIQIRRSADLALKIGEQRLKQNDGKGALDQARVSWRMKKSAGAARLGFLSCLHLGRYQWADRWYRLAVSMKEQIDS